MHRSLPLVGLVVAAISLASCVDSSTAPSSSDLPLEISAALTVVTPNICHHNNSKKGPNWEALVVGTKAVAAHLAHGDAPLGAGQTCPPSASLSLTGNGSYSGFFESHTFTLTNTGNGATGILLAPSLSDRSDNEATFTIDGTTCTGISLAAGASCTIELRFSVDACTGEASVNLNAGDGTLSAQASASGSQYQSCVECTTDGGNYCDAAYSKPFSETRWMLDRRRS